MIFKDVSRIILVGIGLSSLSAIVYVAGPFIAIGDYRPLENAIVRDIVILLLVAAVAGAGGVAFWRRRTGAAKVAAGLGAAEADEGDAAILKERMKDALATLKSAAGGRAAYLYDLPWYVLIGPPGSGKTTALVNSGLKFPLARSARPAAIAGIGGTRYCDWWFTEDAVLIDTAGRYTTQDSDAASDQRSWFAFLDTLKKGRPRQPINGVILAISVEDLLTLGAAEITAHANAIRARLLELHTRLKVDFPVYALLTKADLVLGFTEHFRNLGEAGRQQVFGATFQTDDKSRNLVNLVPEEFNGLVERLNEDMPDRLQEEPDPVTRAQSYGFPTQLEALKRPLFDCLNQIFEPTRYQAKATLRGFYFTSGTQQGTPIDQLIGALEASFGAVEVPASAYSGEGKSYFLTDLIRKVIIGEAAWVSTDRGAVRRAAIVKATAFAGIAVVALGLASLWWISYGRNAGLIDRTNADVAAYIDKGGGVARQTTIGDHDFGPVVQLLDRLRYLPAGYATRDEGVPLAETFGLSQHDRLGSAAVQSYRNGLERMFRPRLIYRLEEVLDARRNDPAFLYNALKVYMMLGGLHVVDRDLVLDWMRADWANNLYPGEGYDAGRKALEGHLQAMLDLETGEPPLFTLSRPLLDDVQGSLAQLSVAQRAYQLLKGQAPPPAGQSDWALTRQGGLQVASVFEPAGPEELAAIHIPYFYTYAGFHRAVLGQIGQIAEKVKQESWVLGDFGKQTAVAEQYRTLVPDLLDLYCKDFIAAWQQMLSKIRLKHLSADKAYVALTAAASPTSPLKQLFQSIRDETALTRALPAEPGKAGSNPPAEPGASILPPLLQDGALGAPVEQAFRPFADMLAGDAGGRPIDLLIKALANIAADLKRAASNPSDRPQVVADLQLQIADLRTLGASLPQPFAAMMQKAAAEFDSQEVTTAVTLLSQSLNEVTQSCKAVAEGHYPFDKGAEREIGLVDFGKVFAPGGLLDLYFNANLAKYVDRTKNEWVWKAGDPVARALSATTLHAFQRAAEIRDGFFAAGAAQPSFMVVVAPPSIADPNVTAKLDFYGASLVSQMDNSPPGALPWPGGGVYQLKITLTTTQPPSADAPASPPAAGTGSPEVSILTNKTGVWSLFHLLDEAGRAGNRVSFFSGGKTYQYQFATSTAANPLNLAALRQFHCPAGI